MRGPRTIRISLLRTSHLCISLLWGLVWLAAAPRCRAEIPSVASSQFHESRIPIAVFRHSEIEDTKAAGCEVSEPPEALATPDPLFDPLDPRGKVAVSFVVGIDGRVHSPVILESAGSAEDRRVLQALRMWRYRPATCNAAPREMESKVEFSSR
jgi:TonB family protein